MGRLAKWLNEFWVDETDYYGDIKACAIFLSFQTLMVGAVIALYLYMGCGIDVGCPTPIF